MTKSKKYDSIRLVFNSPVCMDLAKCWCSLQNISEEMEVDHPLGKKSKSKYNSISCYYLLLCPFPKFPWSIISSSEQLKTDLPYSSQSSMKMFHLAITNHVTLSYHVFPTWSLLLSKQPCLNVFLYSPAFLGHPINFDIVFSKPEILCM